MCEMVINYSSVPVDVIARNNNGVTPLHMAALSYSEACSMLLKYKLMSIASQNTDIRPCNMQLRMVVTRLAGSSPGLKKQVLRAVKSTIQMKN